MKPSKEISKVASLSSIEQFHSLRQDYNATKTSRFTRVQRGLPGNGAGADYHYRSEGDYLKLVEIARDFERNDPLIRAGFNCLVANVIQDGFTLDVQTGSEDVDKLLSENWLEWSESRSMCDITGQLTFKQMESLAFRSITRDGDILAVPVNTGHLKFYEAHRLRTPRRTARNVVHGVMLDRFRRHVEYWVTTEEIEPWRHVEKVSDVRRIPAWDEAGNRAAFHLYLPDRIWQTRGITMVAPVVDKIGMLDDIQFAKLVQQQAVSAYCVFRKRTQGWNPSTQVSGSGLTTTDNSLGFNRVLETMSPGIVGELGPNEDIVGFSPNVPNPEFFEHAMMIMKLISVNLGLPVQVLLLDPSDSTFSSWRGSIDQARIRFKQLQRWLISQFHCEVYRWKVRQWLAVDESLQDALRGGLDIFKHQWNPPAWDYIEPDKDARADALIAANVLNSRRRLLAKRGLEHSVVAVESAEDNAQIVEAAIRQMIRLNISYMTDLENFGQAPITWYEVLEPPVGRSISQTVPVEVKEEEPAPVAAGAA